MNLQSVTLNVMYGALGDDVNALSNKIKTANYITACIKTRNYSYQLTEISQFKKILTQVGSDTTSVNSAYSDFASIVGLPSILDLFLQD